MSEAAKARAAALPLECKKDSLSQLQNGDWKLTLKVAAQDMPSSILEALPGTRYQTAFVEVDDVEQPVQRRDKTDGERAKAHFEAMCQDWNFTEWIVQKNPEQRGRNTSNREMVKKIIGIKSANEIIDHPEKWRQLWDEYSYGLEVG
jgi:hypothetical protein